MTTTPVKLSIREITNPAPGAADVFGDAVLRVRGGMGADEIVVAQAFPKGSEPGASDDPDLATAAECFVHGTSFFRGAVPGAVAGDDGAFILVAWSSPAFDLPDWTQLPTIECTPNPVSKFTVRAEQCLYFAWAPDPKINASLRGPVVPGRQLAGQVELGHEYRPLELHIPAGKNIDISLEDVDARWRHCTGAGCESTADGRAKSSATNDAYHRIDYRSSHIPLPNTNLNKFIGIWGPMNPPSAPVTIVEIGAGGGSFAPPPALADPKSLFLGMHDGFEWNNNADEIVINVTLT